MKTKIGNTWNFKLISDYDYRNYDPKFRVKARKLILKNRKKNLIQTIKIKLLLK